MKRNQKRLLKIIISVVLLVGLQVWQPTNQWVALSGYLLIYLLVGGDVVSKAVKNIIRGQVFDENFLMSIATIGAFFLGDYLEGVAVMLFYQVGELFQSYAVDQSRKSISQLMDIRPDHANLLLDGETREVEPDEVEIGETIIIKPGERVPLDGNILQGNSLLDTSALTGESLPREVAIGDQVLSGCINVSGLLTVEVTKEYGESTVSKILDLVENASSKKAQSENFITKFARYYTPIVVIGALLLAILPPLLIPGEQFADWVTRALTFLVISCPCALVISVPLSFFGGIGGASRLGILIKGSNYLEALAQTGIVVFDKTGTLTKGSFSVQDITAKGITNDELLYYAAYAESYSTHPISVSLKNAYGKSIDEALVTKVEEISGRGVKASVNGKIVLAGNSRLMEENGLTAAEPDKPGTIVHVSLDGQYVGYVLIADEIKPDAASAIKQLKASHVRQTVMLTGDSQVVADSVGEQLGLDNVYGQLLPDQKVTWVEKLLGTCKGKEKLAFVGDGINDAPVLARADIGIAMGGLGSDAAIEAADIVLMTDEPSKLATAIKISHKTLNIVRQNIVFAIAIKVLFLLLGALGIISMGGAIFADVGVTIIAVLNSTRALNVRTFKKNSTQTGSISSTVSHNLQV